MNDTLDIAALFPTPLLRIEIPPELSIACNVFDNAELWLDKESRVDYGLHSKNTYITVSYTHLTLPTKRIV